jgi:hypothetical protein
MEWQATIYGQPRSKANSRRQLKNARTGKMFSAKNQACLDYAESVKVQALVIRPSRLLEGPLSVHGTLFYPDNRSDLDPSLLIDALQGVVFKNDRQVKHWDIHHGIDADIPRAELRIVEMAPPPG